MTDKEYTLLELHLHDGFEFAVGDRIGLSGGEADARDDAGTEPADETGSRGGWSGKKILLLVVLSLVAVGIGLAVRKTVGSDLSAAEELDALGA